MRTGPHDGFVPGQPMNADVEEAADERAESRCNEINYSVSHDARAELARNEESVRAMIEYVLVLGPLYIGLHDLEDFL